MPKKPLTDSQIMRLHRNRLVQNLKDDLEDLEQRLSIANASSERLARANSAARDEGRRFEHDVWVKSRDESDVKLVIGAIAEIKSRLPLPVTVLISSHVLLRMIDVLHRFGLKVDDE